jgi:hypothetical protein
MRKESLQKIQNELRAVIEMVPALIVQRWTHSFSKSPKNVFEAMHRVTEPALSLAAAYKDQAAATYSDLYEHIRLQALLG